MLMYYHADVLEPLLFYGKPFAGALGKMDPESLLGDQLHLVTICYNIVLGSILYLPVTIK